MILLTLLPTKEIVASTFDLIVSEVVDELVSTSVPRGCSCVLHSYIRIGRSPNADSRPPSGDLGDAVRLKPVTYVRQNEEGPAWVKSYKQMGGSSRQTWGSN